jgi:ASC-1-like (ASCH) protein
LPIAIQTMLHEVNADCQISKTNTNLKQNHPCLLRHGVEINKKQSFIACISSALFYGQRDEQTKKPLITKYIPNSKREVPTIKEMKKLIIEAIDIDKFIKYQNGDLITSFANQELKVNIEDYKNSKLFQKMLTKETDNNKKEEIREFIERVAQAFETFKQFLEDDKINIDYTYLWDIVSMPNSKLFEVGINLIILEIPEDDATNNIDLVCPTNHYSIHAYDARKRSLILIKRENYFEPIYGYRNDGNRIYITKTFSEYDRKLPKNLRAVFTKIIKPTIGEKCRAFISRPNEYRFKQAPVLDKLIKDLINKKYKINTQILNFQGKVIGLLVNNKEGLEGFVPCYPSSLTTLKNSKMCDKVNEIKTCEYDFVYMNDNIWKPYKKH